MIPTKIECAIHYAALAYYMCIIRILINAKNDSNDIQIFPVVFSARCINEIFQSHKLLQAS